ncbi:SDR family NAD(P)-dependent oxidoreductase [Curtobacterium oceanosedimentum]|uniref:SDR family NAD(P)-dependent oxidoreductase n=1 Tax=Curtobacterium oceanosedimentum TaxID=465820 RepID=UPI0033983712
MRDGVDAAWARRGPAGRADPDPRRPADDLPRRVHPQRGRHQPRRSWRRAGREPSEHRRDPGLREGDGRGRPVRRHRGRRRRRRLRVRRDPIRARPDGAPSDEPRRPRHRDDGAPRRPRGSGHLVNNAGVYPGGPTESLDDATVDDLLATNIRAPHVLVAALAPGMAERGSGHIVNIGSWMARVGVPFMALYPATKAAVEQLTRAWAAEYGHRGIRVVTVAPGATATPGNADSADVLAAMTQGTPAGVPVQPVDIARAVRWVVSDQAAFVTGGTIDVDGGIASTRMS